MQARAADSFGTYGFLQPFKNWFYASTQCQKQTVEQFLQTRHGQLRRENDLEIL